MAVEKGGDARYDLGPLNKVRKHHRICVVGGGAVVLLIWENKQPGGHTLKVKGK